MLALTLLLAGGPLLLAQSDELDIKSTVIDYRNEARYVQSSTGEEAQSSHEWLIAPIPSKNPALGWTLALPVAILYTPASAGPDSPPWMTGAGGFATDNGSWGGGLFHKMNLQDDRWRLLGAAFYGDIKYKYYGSGEGAGDPDRYIGLNQTGKGVLLEGLRAVANHTYVGLRLMKMQADFLAFDIPILDKPIVLPPDWDVGLDIVNLSPRFVYDSRDNEFYPRSGNLVDLTLDFSSMELGSDFGYELFSASWNHYRAIGEDAVLALRVAYKHASGDVPFFLLPAIGQGSDLRGYPAGVYRDRTLVAGQAEFRYRLTDRWGLVAFGGVAGLGENIGELGEALPSYGGGIRWVVAPANDVSLKLDVAKGKHDVEFYVGIGEAF